MSAEHPAASTPSGVDMPAPSQAPVRVPDAPAEGAGASAATTEPRENAAIYELERRLEQEERNIESWQRGLLEAIESEKRAHEAVERMKANLNGAVQKRVDIEDALRRLRA